jgi:2,4-dienoyl-CoA reductase (NADPH2)
MGRDFPHLSSPVRVGGVTLKNRMMTTSMSPGAGYIDAESRPTQRFLNYLEQRAAGQTALIVQTICPHERTAEHPGMSPIPGSYDESCVPHLAKMAEVVHKHGGLLVGQPYFVHDWKSKTDEDEIAWGPSDISILAFMGPFKAMELEHIAIFKQQFVNCVRVMKAAGWDGVEVMAGVGGILNRFLSPATNNRTDQYGGSLENRVRLAVEVIEEVRAEVGPDFPILVRWSPVEYVKSPHGEGHGIEQSLEVVPHLERAGADLHDLAVGWHETSVPLTTKQVKDGQWSWISEQIKTVATKPVVTAYRETDPKVMEQILREGKADVIGGLRYSIADPEFPRKVIEDRAEDIAMCICCNRCLDDVVGKELPLEKCGMNPRLGPELDTLTVPPATTRKKVMVVGSGPGGLRAALTASERGHDVTVYELGPRIGGSVKMSSIFSPLHERLLSYYKVQLRKHPEVKIRLRTPVTPDLVRQVKPDAVIVANGGEPKGIDVPGVEGRNVVTSHDFLQMLSGNPPKKSGLINSFMWKAGAVVLRMYYTPGFARVATKYSPWPLRGSVAIIGGGLPGCELGELTMHSPRTTTIFEEGKKIGYDVGASDRFHVTSAFKKSPKVTTYPSTRVTEITPDGVRGVQQTPEGEQQVEAKAKTVAVTLGFQPNMDLFTEIEKMGIEVYAAGDCRSPGRIADATKAGYQAAVRI